MAKLLTVGSEEAGKRVDLVSSELMPKLSRAYVRRLIDAGRITINQATTKAGARLHLGDVLQTDFDEKELDVIEPIDLPVLYEDSDILVINKPSGVISHSRGRYWDEPSVASFVRQKTGQSGERAGIVHRLDRATSGVMICAKNADMLSWLQKQFSSRKVNKTYTAVVSGELKEPAAIIDIPIERNPKAPATFRTGSNGKSAQTEYRVLASNKDYSLLELKPRTGRTHQLRVHLKYLGHAIVGDTLYDGEAADRLLLHALSLSIPMPSGTKKTFTAPLPDIFNRYVHDG